MRVGGPPDRATRRRTPTVPLLALPPGMVPKRIGSLSALLLVAAAAWPSAASASQPPFRVGAAVANIDPSYPVYMGGYGGGPSGGTIARHIDPLTGKAEHFTGRAIAIRTRGKVRQPASADTQGFLPGYQEGPSGDSDVRKGVAG